MKDRSGNGSKQLHPKVTGDFDMKWSLGWLEWLDRNLININWYQQRSSFFEPDLIGRKFSCDCFYICSHRFAQVRPLKEAAADRDKMDLWKWWTSGYLQRSCGSCAQWLRVLFFGWNKVCKPFCLVKSEYLRWYRPRCNTHIFIYTYI